MGVAMGWWDPKPQLTLQHNGIILREIFAIALVFGPGAGVQV